MEYPRLQSSQTKTWPRSGVWLRKHRRCLLMPTRKRRLGEHACHEYTTKTRYSCICNGDINPPRDGKIADEARRRIEYELDLEEARVANRGKDGGGLM